MRLPLACALLLSVGCSSALRQPAPSPGLSAAVKNELLELSLDCAEAACTYVRGKHVFLTYRITNRHTAGIEVAFPALERNGPEVCLVDTRTGKMEWLVPNMPDPTVLGRFIRLAPGESASAAWPIYPVELAAFGHDSVDVTARVAISMPIRVGMVERIFQAEASVRVVERSKPR